MDYNTLNYDAIKLLILAGLSGYVGTLLRTLPMNIFNYFLYVFSKSTRFASDAKSNMYFEAYFAMRKYTRKSSIMNHLQSPEDIYSLGFPKLGADVNHLYLSKVVVDCVGEEYLNKLIELSKKRNTARTSITSNIYLSVEDYLTPTGVSDTEDTELLRWLPFEPFPNGNKWIYVGDLTWVKMSSSRTTRSDYNTTGGTGNNRGFSLLSLVEFIYSMDLHFIGLKSEEKFNEFMALVDQIHVDTVRVSRSWSASVENDSRDETVDAHVMGEIGKSFKYKTRKFESIFIDNKEDVIKSLDNLFSIKRFTKLAEFNYIKKANILIQGSPGTGKSSLIKAIIDRYKVWDVCLIDDPLQLNNILSNYENIKILVNDKDRQAVYNTVKVNTIALIEEIDQLQYDRTKSSNEEDNTISKMLLRNLLETMDGQKTPDGLVTICTTNHPENLDPAILRRFDLVITMDGLSYETAIDMCKYFKIPENKIEEVIKSAGLMDNGKINPSKLSNSIFNTN